MMNREFTSLLRKLQSPNRYAQSTAFKALAASIQEAKSSDIEELLELLISTHDVEIQMKLLAVLASYLINNGIHYRDIVKYYPLYDAIQNILVRGLPVKAVSGLNFIVALLYCVDGDERGVATQARNMLRLSGCLNAMADMFSSSMMYQDTWVALCQSLAEACSGCEVNQSYCSHLVPLCVQRCRQGNVDVCAVLQSLLHNHDRNIQLFIESQGPTIFTRQALQYNMCMQLLSSVVERSAAAVEVLRNTDVVFHLRDFLHLYGPYSQMGQWSTIILFHFNRRQGPIANVTKNVQREPNNNERNENQTNSVIDLDHTINDPTKDTTTNTKGRNSTGNNFQRNRSVFVAQRNDTFCKPVQNAQENPDDTAKLLQNVIREAIYWKSREQKKTTQQPNPRPQTSTQLLNPKPKQNLSNVMKFPNKPKIPSTYHEPQEKNLTFSFLVKENGKNYKKQPDFYPNDNITESSLTDNDKVPSNLTKRYIELDARERSEENFYNAKRNDNQSAVLLEDFNPPFISTPKRRNKTEITNHKEKELSFSFLVHESQQYPRKQPDFYQNDKLIESYLTDNDKVPLNATKRYMEQEALERSDASNFYAKESYNHKDVLIKEFNPPFNSTPRYRGKIDNTKITRRSFNSRLSSRKLSRNLTKVSKTSQTDNAMITEQNNTLNPTTDIKHTSMSARLFNAINESCTTFVKSVKSIFRSKQDNKDNDKTLAYDNNNCSFSFTNYMRKRDELLKDYSNNESISGTYKVDSCKTCKDTIVLQQKMVRDDDLKLTVKKLKKGINLYGCDFKKISKAFWPRDKYMTPEMLYNLYRKLIVKGGHGNHEFRQKAYTMIRKK